MYMLRTIALSTRYFTKSKLKKAMQNSLHRRKGEQKMDIRLLIADDNAIQIDSILLYVDWEALGVTQIKTASDGEQCYEIAKEFLPHIVIADIEMPRMNGMELAAKLKEFDKNINLIFITCHENFKYAQQAIALGVAAYILKPISYDEISEIARDIIFKLEEDNEKREHEILFSKKQKEIEKDFYEFFDEYNRLDVLKIYDSFINLLNEEKDFTTYLKEQYFRYLSEQSFAYTKYMCYTMINAVQLVAKVKNIDLDDVLGQGRIWDKLATFTDKDDIVNWLSEFMQMVFFHINQNEKTAYKKVARDIKNIIDNNLYEITNISLISEKLQISSSYAGRMFKKAYGITIFDYLFEKRMQEAKRLLEDPYMKVYEIAEKLGYNNKAYFSSTFQKYWGMTPSEFRKSKSD